MGKRHNIITPAELKKLDQKKKADLQKEMTQHIKNDPMLKEVVKLHGKARKHLKNKLKI
jgi:hypothetical protein